MTGVENYADFLRFPDDVDLTNYFHYQEGFTSEETEQISALGLEAASIAGTAGGIVNPSYRSSHISWMPLSDDTHWIFERVGDLARRANEALWKFSLAAITEQLQFTEYYTAEDGHYDWHMDLGASTSRRKVSVVVQLTDPAEYEGGELQLLFGRSPRVVPRKQGHVTVFPSYVLHRVTPVTQGRRQSLVVWVSGDPFR